ncbi:rhodanese-like domain-containing protein [Curtobacterium sp. MCLR17_007]|uniref:rhodanese-like domain-containing protein n=1 Tax=unclassified Curtobacterium TaxID=257496 RepID=UPI000AE9997B|nr:MULTISPECIES: rhodanese-like domain-containing protein [unclassified Curtobacterium]WIB58646.1 rhodanese-like domain-containing protein [Curtobacterium sp. MCLR17_007]
MQEISTDEAMARIASGARLYDVREQGEWDEVHAPQATLVPLSEFAERWTEIESSDEPAIVVCHSGMRSARVVQALEQQGVPAVNLAGGMVAWEAQGGPVVHPGTGDAEGERGHGH